MSLMDYKRKKRKKGTIQVIAITKVSITQKMSTKDERNNKYNPSQLRKGLMIDKALLETL